MKSLTGILVFSLAWAGICDAQNYAVVDTGQNQCFDSRVAILAPKSGQTFYGQDAQFKHHPASYSLNADGLTVADNTTGLIWQCSPARDKLMADEALALPAKLNARRFGGFGDWRLPSIKELYSLFNASGIDPSGPPGMDTSRLKPFIDTKYFKFAYGDARAGERIIDSQYATSTRYAGWSAGGAGKMFGVNFADGRIKGYDLQMPGGRQKTFFVLCVRGNPAYGKNDFRDNGDGTVTDSATGLMWTKSDGEKGMIWQAALAWAQEKNAARFLGHNDWRLPNVKELQSIVDYTRSPDVAHSPAIDPVFNCTAIHNETGEPDFPFYWSSTTHVNLHGGDAAMYIAFGRAAGWMRPPFDRDGEYHYLDVHGAGAQRSDPKAGDPAAFPYGRGPQGDVIRIYNYVRLVRNTL